MLWNDPYWFYFIQPWRIAILKCHCDRFAPGPETVCSIWTLDPHALRAPWIHWCWSWALLYRTLAFWEKAFLSGLLLPFLWKLILWSVLAYVLTSRSHRWIYLLSLLVFFWCDVAFIIFSEKGQFFIFLFSTECVRS